MINFEGIVIIAAESGTPMFSKLHSIDDALFSGFLSAIRAFSEEMSLGKLSSFVTDEKSIYLIGREDIIVAIISPTNEEFTQVYSFGRAVAQKFEELYDISGNITNQSYFDDFQSHLEKLQQPATPFLIQVAEFVNKEFAGDISMDVNLINNEKEEKYIDIIVDNGKKSGGFLLGKGIKRRIKAFSKELTFTKVIDGTAGKGEVEEFFDLMKTFGTRDEQKIKQSDVFPFFPSKAIIVARSYSPTVVEFLEQFDKDGDKTYIPGDHLARVSKLPIAPSATKCYIELWQWHDSKYPERIYD